jgi:hypothetical protein
MHMPAQKREVKRNYIGLVGDESEQQCAAEARPKSGRPAKDYIGRLVAAMLERRGAAR